jgi:transcriptional regulator with XRE-family HTH domain
MSADRVGPALRAIRFRRGWTQAELAARAALSRGTISRLETGRVDRVPIGRLEVVARTLGATVDVRIRWQGDELDRLLNREHSALHEQMARIFGRLPGWRFAPEVSFSRYGERGIIDILAFHEPTRRLLVIELKTLIVDVQQVIGVVDRYRRLARTIAEERGWRAEGVSVWLIVAATRTNERRMAAHRTVLRTAFPADGRAMRRWLAHPSHDIAAMSSPPLGARESSRQGTAGRRRVSGRRPPISVHGSAVAEPPS